MSRADCLCDLPEVAAVTIPDCMGDGVCHHAAEREIAVRGSAQLENGATDAEIWSELVGFFNRAAAIIGATQYRHYVVDRTGHKVAIRAMAGGHASLTEAREQQLEKWAYDHCETKREE